MRSFTNREESTRPATEGCGFSDDRYTRAQTAHRTLALCHHWRDAGGRRLSRMPEPNAEDWNDHGSCLENWQAAKSRHGCPDIARDKWSAGMILPHVGRAATRDPGPQRSPFDGAAWS